MSEADIVADLEMVDVAQQMFDRDESDSIAPVVDPGSFERAAEFLARVGIPMRIQVGAKGFLEGIRIERGTLLVDRPDDSLVGNLLHEAGHLAMIPKRFWPLATGGLFKVNEAMTAYCLESSPGVAFPEDMVLRACLQSGDPEATAWSFAAAHDAGIDTRTPFYGYYDGTGHHVHLALSMNAYLGINGLAACRMTAVRRTAGHAAFPAMSRWVAAD